MAVSPDDGVPPADSPLAERLRTGELTPVGRFAAASNATLLCRVGDSDTLAVYKPRRGEAPLWDFPPGTLWLREVAAYVLAGALGWPLVPVTVRREEGPHGPGSVQHFVDHDPDHHYFWLLEHGGEGILAQLRRMVVFDLLANNADRKASHVLLAEGDRILLVDHGVCFAAEPKLRTVAWHFAGEPVPEAERSAVVALAERLREGQDPAGRLAGLLSDEELAALADRAELVAGLRELPAPSGPRPFPWPPL